MGDDGPTVQLPSLRGCPGAGGVGSPTRFGVSSGVVALPVPVSHADAECQTQNAEHTALPLPAMPPVWIIFPGGGQVPIEPWKAVNFQITVLASGVSLCVGIRMLGTSKKQSRIGPGCVKRTRFLCSVSVLIKMQLSQAK